MRVPFTRISPDISGSRPEMASASSDCPFPCTPAMPTTSPRCTLRETFFTAGSPILSQQEIFSASRITSPGLNSSLLTSSITSRPTIIMAIFFSSVSLVSTLAVTTPARITVIRSVTSLTSANLWVIKMMHFPFFFKFISVSISCRISWGVRTAVGSSIIRISAPRYSAFKISTLC